MWNIFIWIPNHVTYETTFTYLAASDFWLILLSQLVVPVALGRAPVPVNQCRGSAGGRVGSMGQTPVCWGWDRGSSSATDVLSPFLAFLSLLRSTWICASKIVVAELSKPIWALEAYPQAREEMFPYSEKSSRTAHPQRMKHPFQGRSCIGGMG